MAEITAALVKDLREKTGAGMMDCKRALSETAGDIEGAVDWLRKKGLAAAAKKAGRVAAEGLIGVAIGGNLGAVVEVNAETDFVARNDTFQKFTAAVAELALTHVDLERLKLAPYPGTGRKVEEELSHLIATVGENMSIRRMARLHVPHGVVMSYVHNAVAPHLGKIGVLVALESTAPAERLGGVGRQIAMHIAAARPQYLDIAAVPAADLARERDVLREQAKASGKPDKVIEQMVEGRLRKFYEETVLNEQIFVIDNETKVSKILDAAAKELGAGVRIAAFERLVLGEGIEKEASDFAAEVAATLKPS
ncbi:MAG TPA: translation elongation factor Ts [Stellaceae bacterium]|nr:translation elongation factor Ts [Stellaceae bacterium]